MQYGKFGNTGLTVSRLTLGTMTFGLQTGEDVSRSIMDRAAEAGVNFIDTANVYPLGSGHDLAGRTEEIVGRWLKGRRDDFVLATKAVHEMGPHAWQKGASRKHLLDAIDASLKRLNTDYVDLYQLHNDDRDTPLDEMLEALDTIVRQGKARYIGVSNFWLTGSRGRSAARMSGSGRDSCRCSRAITCCFARSSGNCCRSRRRKVSL